jgi:hypothetical protein
VKDEYAFTTDVLSEGEFADKTKEFDNVVNVIRIK